MRRIVFVLAFVLMTSSFVSAQGLGLGPQLGFQKAADAEEGKLMGGVALRMKLSPALGVEGSINYRQEEYEDGAVTVKSWPVMVTGMVYPIPVAYGLIGAGWYNTTMDYDEDMFLGVVEIEDETTQNFGWHFGGGVEFPVGTNMKLAADIRYVFLDYDFEEAPGSEDVESDFFMINVGLLFGL